ncbi:SMC family ATPase [Candidatus Palauibacter soopunensis]|uniref:SMC family ATPase n=1 Tax=Candidatus Palauibacter soopunensis TaxID=3056739 RepID=UPI00238C5356|nr:SMC family ATPase [Candidatus Palauibacter soopunensis]MDE2879645.1 SMC family ATPase [Candidatus Palauibacter soopunensis]
MRPVRLVVEGFTSFRKAQEIDFGKLDLFVIAGPTGSGKTSILDAVTLALYGMVPRAGKRDLKELISLGASEAKVQLDFRVADAEYRVARRIRKQGAQVATLERIEGETATPEVERGGVTAVSERVVEILGLDYGSFTTAVLLPQGDFASFLRGDVTERRRILIRLLDLHRFERAGALARKKASDLRAAVETRVELLAQEFGDATGEALEEAAKRAQEAEEAAGTVEAAYRAARDSLAVRTTVAGRCGDIADLATALDAQGPQLEESAATLKEQSAREAETKSAVDAAERVQSDAQEARRQARETWNETEEETGGEGVLATLKAAAESLRQADEEIKSRSVEVDENAQALEEAKSRAEELQAKQESAHKAEADATEAHEVAVKVRSSAEETLRIAEHAEKLSQDLQAKVAESEALGDEVAEIEADRQEALKDRHGAESKLQVIEAEHRAAVLRLHLEEGDECPVCGASIEELPATEAETESVLAEHRTVLQEAQETFVSTEKRLSSKVTKQEECDAAAKALEQQLEELEHAISPEDARAARARATKREADAKRNLDAEGDRNAAILDELAESKAKLAALQATGREAEKARDLAWERVEAANIRLSDGLGDPIPEPVEDVIEARMTRLRDAADVRKKAEAAHEEAEEAHRKAVQAWKVVDDGLADLDRQRGHHRTLLGERCVQLRRLEVEVPDPPQPPDPEDRKAETHGLHAYSRSLRETAGQQIAELETAVEALDASICVSASDVGIEAASLDAAAATSALEETAREARRTADQSAVAVASIEKQLERKAQLQEDIDEKRDRMYQYDKVANELKTDRFIGFLLDESIGDLALRASNELKKISAGQYSLTSFKNNFTVIDHANADERRSVVTLSGGETFLASLALALALAHGIADIAGHSAGARLDAMFIDEGFGTLDPESLDQAVEALERLRDGERMVGIITHVPTLTERIPDGLSVERKVGGTVVRVR